MRENVWLWAWCRVSGLDTFQCRVRVMVRVTIGVRVRSQEGPGSELTPEQLSPCSLPEGYGSDDG